jgi:PAS domain S-box-containing protein
VESGEERWSDEFYRVLGFERETHEAIFESIRKRIHPDDLDGMVEARERALHENQPFDHEFRIVLANGEIRHLHSMGQVTLKRAGMPARMSGTVQDITQRKKTEEALRDSEQMLRGIFETAAIGICANDEAGRYIKFNPAYQEMLGLTAEELSTKTFWDITHPEDQHLEEPHFADMLSGRVTSYQFEKRYIHKNGSIIWVSLNVADLKSVDGTVIGSIATVEDITERKRAEEALRKSEAHLKEAQRVAHIGSWEYDEQTNEFSWSDELFRITGVKKENFKPSYESFLEIIHPDDRDLLLEGRRRALAGENDDSLVFRLVHPDGEIRHVRRVAMTSAREDGKVIRRAGTAQDITEQVAAETALRESEARLMEAQEIANVGSWVSYFEGERLVRNVWSAQLCRIFGIELDAVPKDFEEYLKFVHEDDRDLVRRTLSLAIESDTPYEIEHRIVRPNGDVRYIYDKSRYVEEQTPGNKRLHGASSDITERKQAEEKLQQAQKMEAVGQLTGGVAHDFNNLLTVIMGNLELIRDTVGDDSALNNMIDRGIRASEHGAALTHRLLAFSRKQTLIPTEFNLGNVVAGMTEMLRRTLGEVIEIVNVGAGDIWPCRADQSQLEAALLNLALNARDAMSHGGRLTIETANISLIDHDSAAEVDVEPGDYVMLVVSDTGSGIAEEKLEHVFEPFFTTKEVGEGSGLGLSMVYGYAKQSGGNVMIFSNLGEGTTVKLYLPRSAVANDHVALKQAASAIPQSNREHILIVEDDADVRMLAVNVLSDLGYRVVEAGSAEAALDAVEHAAVPIDLLLSDVVLSGAMTGPELAAEVQRRNPAVKTVYMTGYAEEALNDDTARDERMHMILKPFKRVDLAKVIRCVLDDHGSRA